eukprot:gene24912-33405_t
MNVRDVRTALTHALPSFQCPLLLDIMSDPVLIQRTGQTYERTAIERWLATHDTCPSTGVQLFGHRELIPNFALKSSIDEWKARTDRALQALNHTVPFENITVGELLARGRTKDVHRGLLLGKPVAVCVLKGPAEVVGDREADILSSIGKHPNIVRFLARSQDAQGRSMVVLELAPQGKNLVQVISECHEGDVEVSEPVVLQLLRQVAAGMEVLHSNGIVHRDLAARNILVFSFHPTSVAGVLVKVSDFGMSSLLDQAAATPSAYYYGGAGSGSGAGQRELPVRWMAAEALERNKWSEKTDVYAFGVLGWEVLSGGSVPWGMGLSNREVQDQVLRGQRLPCQPSWPRGLVELIGRCCSLRPADRPTFTEILQQLSGLEMFGQHEDSPGRDFLRGSFDEGSVAWQDSTSRSRSREILAIMEQVKRRDAGYPAEKGPGSVPLQWRQVRGEEEEKASAEPYELLVCGGAGAGAGEEAALSIADCAVLRALLDQRWSEQQPPSSSSSSSSDFKLPLSFAELEQLVGQSSAQRLSVLARGFFDKILLRRCSAEEKPQQEGEGKGDGGQGLCIRFHLDESQQVLQVALNDDCEYSGGRLIFLTAADGNSDKKEGEEGFQDQSQGQGQGQGRLVVPKRAAGSYTLHNCHVVHGVSEHRAGLRYGLFLIKERNSRSQSATE